MKKLPKKARNGKLLHFRNFYNENSYVNMVKFREPYANGALFCVWDANGYVGVFTKQGRAKDKFDEIVNKRLAEITHTLS